MSTKRRKISHETGAAKESSVQIPKAKSKPQPAPKRSDPSPTTTSEDESVTVDNAPGQGNAEPAPKSFRDLVRCSQCSFTRGH
jgi:ATP-dependent RNA helicase DDX47/RRP3